MEDKRRTSCGTRRAACAMRDTRVDRQRSSDVYRTLHMLSPKDPGGDHTFRQRDCPVKDVNDTKLDAIQFQSVFSHDNGDESMEPDVQTMPLYDNGFRTDPTPQSLLSTWTCVGRESWARRRKHPTTCILNRLPTVLQSFSQTLGTETHIIPSSCGRFSSVPTSSSTNDLLVDFHRFRLHTFLDDHLRNTHQSWRPATMTFVRPLCFSTTA